MRVHVFVISWLGPDRQVWERNMTVDEYANEKGGTVVECQASTHHSHSKIVSVFVRRLRSAEARPCC
eukprot:scaffold281538_cov36-Tisochrysis_lutea.AAC.5